MGSTVSNLAHGRFVAANKKFLEYVGWSLEELKNKTWNNLTPEDGKWQDVSIVAELMARGRYGPFSRTLIHKDGSSILVTLSGLKVLIEGVAYNWSIIESGMIIGGDVADNVPPRRMMKRGDATGPVKDDITPPT